MLSPFLCHQAQLWGALSRSELVTSALGVAIPSVVQSVFWGLALELLVVIAVGYFCKVRVFVFARQRGLFVCGSILASQRTRCGGCFDSLLSRIEYAQTDDGPVRSRLTQEKRENQMHEEAQNKKETRNTPNHAAGISMFRWCVRRHGRERAIECGLGGHGFVQCEGLKQICLYARSRSGACQREKAPVD